MDDDNDDVVVVVVALLVVVVCPLLIQLRKVLVKKLSSTNLGMDESDDCGLHGINMGGGCGENPRNNSCVAGR